MAQINIFGELHNVTGEPIAAAEQVMDNTQGKMQSEINAELYEKLSLAGKAASDYPTSINLRDIEGEGKGFDSLENIFTYEGEATTWRIVSYGDVDHAEDEDPTYDYCVFRIGSGDKYMVYYMPEYVEEGKHAFQYEETLSKDEIYDPIKKAYDIPEKANVKKLSYNRRDIFQSDRIQVFVGESGNVLTPVYLRHGALQYILFKDGDIYVIYHKSSGNVYAFSNTYSDATAEDWVKEAFETGKTYTAGDGVSISEENVISSTWRCRTLTKEDIPDDEGLYIDCNTFSEVTVILDWREETEGLDVYCTDEDGNGSLNEMVLYFSGTYAPTFRDYYGTIGDLDIRGGYEYMAVVQGGILIAQPIAPNPNE